MPTTYDHAWITNAGTYTGTVSGGSSAGELTVCGISGTQTVSSTSATFMLGNGTANTNAVLRTSSGTLGGTGRFIIAGTISCTGGTITNTVQRVGKSISGSGKKIFRYGGLINSGLLTFSVGYLELYNGAVITNLATATFDIMADYDIGYYSGPGKIYNSGIFSARAEVA